MLRAGAAGYLTKERAPEELCQAVQHIVRGGTYLSQYMSRRTVGLGRAGVVDRPHEGLSAREFQVLRMIAGGKSGKAAANELGLSQKTISTYRVRIFKKLQVRSTAELVQYAVHERLI